MDLNFLMEYKSWPRWKVLQGELIRSHMSAYRNSYVSLSYYDLIEVAVINCCAPNWCTRVRWVWYHIRVDSINTAKARTQIDVGKHTAPADLEMSHHPLGANLS